MVKIISLITSLIMFFFPMLNVPHVEVDKTDFNTEYANVFVHGLSGWGSYDWYYKLMPYWGVLGGDLMQYLNARGFECYSASVGGTESAWDRACELYAQLTGTVTDYGEEHSARCNHDRYGEDYTGRALIDEWNDEEKINLFGHSFGGATVRIFAEIMANGSAAEREASGDDVSDFFKGGKADWIYSVTTLAAPHNGTTAVDVRDEILADLMNSTIAEIGTVAVIGIASLPVLDGRDTDDSAVYDMAIDNAMALNENISTLENVYYFSYACSATEPDENGYYVPIDGAIEGIYSAAAARMGCYTGTTEAGYVIDEKWFENDGLVNTYSALAPIGAPSVQYNSEKVTTGVWNVMPVYKADHMSLQGGMTVNNNVRIFYIDLLSMINSL